MTELVWAKFAEDIEAGIAQVKRIKRWQRDWKFELIESANPKWEDLFDLLV